MLGRKLGSLAGAFALFVTALIAVLGSSAQPRGRGRPGRHRHEHPADEPAGARRHRHWSRRQPVVRRPANARRRPTHARWRTDDLPRRLRTARHQRRGRQPVAGPRQPGHRIRVADQPHDDRRCDHVLVLRSAFSTVDGIAYGPDGNIWFTNSFADFVGRLTPTGTVTTFSHATIINPTGITAGPDGAIWFTNVGQPAPLEAPDDSIGRITTAGAVTSFPDPQLRSPSRIVSGPDGALWFANNTGGLGRVTTSGAFSYYTFTSSFGPFVRDVTFDGSGRPWFIASFGEIGVLRPNGSIDLFPVASSTSITLGSDGAIWFTGYRSVGRITSTGAVTSIGDDALQPHGITTDAAGNLWFTNEESTTVSRRNASGDIDTFFTDLANPRAITRGPDGRIYYTTAGVRLRRQPTGLGGRQRRPLHDDRHELDPHVHGAPARAASPPDLTATSGTRRAQEEAPRSRRRRHRVPSSAAAPPAPRKPPSRSPLVTRAQSRPVPTATSGSPSTPTRSAASHRRARSRRSSIRAWRSTTTPASLRATRRQPLVHERRQRHDRPHHAVGSRHILHPPDDLRPDRHHTGTR